MIHIALFAAVLAQTPPPPAQQPPPVDCADADHSGFNFWIGDWDVRQTGSETVVAHSIISAAVGGCAIEENYHQTVGPGGVVADYRGASFSSFDGAGGGKWRQFYVDNGGSVTTFEGAVQDGAMVMFAPGPRNLKLRMIVAPQPDGSVRQSGGMSRDGGETWTSSYDFTYRRR